jgi:ribosome-associated heat shock protein Hsp15
MSEAGCTVQRIDQWLWFARITKSRTLAQALVARGKVRLNRTKIDKASLPVRPGDVLTLMLGPNVHNVEVLAIGARRGPAAEAQRLYRDLTPKPCSPGIAGETHERRALASPLAVRSEGAGRPTKRERRETDRLKGR